ncbi:MAG: (Fe-S)-binding protein [Planctomycetales bacterium]|nr:(Fe-S)-binding protein [Planctomycetales bacterium]
MRVGLFIPCYIDQFYPDVGLATVDLLEGLGVEVEFPAAQTCCGQPMANTGCNDSAQPLARRFVEIFAEYPYVVAPSGSCVAMVRHHYDHFFHDSGSTSQLREKYLQLRDRTFELCEFLVDVLKVDRIDGRFPHRVGLHQSCHGLRELRMGSSSERVECDFSKPAQLLATLEGLEFSQLQRQDECCGFGGTFAVSEEAVSCRMGMDRIADHEQAGTEVLTAADMSCLMHLEGLLRRQRKSIRVMHVAQILAGRAVPA